MSTPKRILYINHAGTLRGASMSLLYTIQGLDSHRFLGMVAVAAPEGEVSQLYKDSGLETSCEPAILQWHFSTGAPRHWFNPRTWIEITRITLMRTSNDRAMDNIITKFGPDLVHLNSMALSASALYLKRHNIPFVWHVREPPQTTSVLSVRRCIIGKLLRELPGESIFLSEYDRKEWTGTDNGAVIPNFVDFASFDRNIPPDKARQELDIPADSPVLLFMGGLRDIKGIFTLIRALRIVVKEYPDLRCIMPGSDYSPPRSFAMWLARTVGPLFNHAPTGLRAIKMISAFGLEQVCIRLPYRTDIPDIIAASSIVLFPSRKPHFARPVIEASAMGKPVVASALPGVSELIRDGETGTLIPPGNPRALARAIGDLLADPERMRALGNNGYRLAHDNFSRMTACQRIMAIYADALP